MRCLELGQLADASLGRRYIYTGGSESYIRVFESDPESTKEARLIEYCDEGITSLSCSVSRIIATFQCTLELNGAIWQDEYLCSAEEDGRVALHSHGTNEFVALVTRCALPIRSARFDPKGKRIAVTSESVLPFLYFLREALADGLVCNSELIVKVVDVKDTLKIQLLTGHTKAVREATWSPDGALLVRRSLCTLHNDADSLCRPRAEQMERSEFGNYRGRKRAASKCSTGLFRPLNQSQYTISYLRTS